MLIDDALEAASSSGFVKRLLCEPFEKRGGRMGFEIPQLVTLIGSNYGGYGDYLIWAILR